jgi:DNA polymerase-1
VLIDETNFSDFMSWLAYQEEIAIDTETTGLDPYGSKSLSRICGVSIAGVDNSSYYLPFRHHVGYNLPLSKLSSLISLLNDRVNSGNLTLLFWNADFDLHMLAVDGFRVPYERGIEDYMLGAHLLNENEPSFGLKEYGDKYGFGRGSLDESDLREIIESRYGKTKAKEWKGSIWKLSGAEVAAYAETDATLTLAAARAMRPALVAWHLSDLFVEQNRYLLTIVRMEARGILVDVDRIESQIKLLGPRREENFDEILGIVKKITGSTLDPTPRPVRIGKKGLPLKQKPSLTFNPNSVPQLLALTNWPKTDVKYLEELEVDDPWKPFADLVLDYRVMSKMTGTYYDAYLELIDAYNTIRPRYNLIGTVSGRLSCSRPNLQNVPRWSEKRPVKEVFIPREGYVFVEMDYSQAELRIATHYANEHKMRAIFYQGLDPHGETATRLSIPRFVAKTLNFLIIYGGGIKAIMRTLGCSEEVARAYLRGYHGLYVGFGKLAHFMQEKASDDGYIRLETGRIRHFNTWKYHQWEAEPRKAMNSLIQGTAAEMLRIAMVRLEDELRGSTIDAHMLLQVHDSILLECRPDHVDRLVAMMSPIMTGFHFDPGPAIDIKVGSRWSPMEPIAA